MDEHTQNELGLLIGKIVEQQNQMVLNIQQKNLEQEKMCWNDVRKKLPEVKDQDCLVKNENEFHNPMHRAYWSEGYFFSNETNHSFPLLVTHWMILPEE